MANKERPDVKKEGVAERTARFFRNVNILGAVAIGGAAILAPPVAVAPLTAWAGLNAAQAGGFEVARRWAKKQREKTG